MDTVITELSASAQTAYAQLLDATLNAEHIRSVADLNGSFNAKVVNGRKYWYFQYFEASGALRQIYVGPDNDQLRALIERTREPGPSAGLEPLARSAASLGCAKVTRKHGRVLRRLAEYGFFKAGGLLIGTHAFLTYGNMLGVRWGSHDVTQDIDFAHAGKSLALGLPNNLAVKTADAIESLGMGFLPITGLSGKTGGSFLNPKEPEFRLDFLTTLHRGGDKPFVHPQLNVTLQPLRFMEFLLQPVEQAVVFSTEHIVLVNIPDPARFALHKLIVSGERTGAFRLKAAKDLAQAAHLLAWLWPNRRDSVSDALEVLISRGSGWRTRLRRGVASLLKAAPALQDDASLRDALTLKG
jgi:hypothetical protein